MNKSPLPWTFVFGVVLLFLAPPLGAKDLVVKPPPESMSKLYPPESKEPKWIQQMHKMSGHFGGVFVNMREQDWENVDRHAAALVEAYEETSKLIPEWEDYFDLDAARKFADAAQSHNPEQIGKAAGALGKTCGKCHRENYVSVWTRFHWPKFSAIQITDPVDEKEMEFGKYMGLVSGSFKGVTVNFGEGQYDRAHRALRTFKTRYLELRSVCAKCHTNDDVKLFYVGAAAEEAFAGMDRELTKKKPDPGQFWRHVGTLGQTGCKRCHLTHRGYAIIQNVWEAD